MIRSLALLLALTSSASAAPPVKGMALGLYHREADEKGWTFDDMLDEIREVGADHVSLVVSWKQHDVKSTEIVPDPKVTIPDARLRMLIRQARKRGLKVFLFPI